MIIAKPHILSIHPTMQCDYHCVGCYLKRDEHSGGVEMPPSFFVELVKVAKSIGIKEIAIPANFKKVKNNPLKPADYELDKNIFYYTLLKNAAKEHGLEFTCTANYDFITNYIETIHGLLDDVSLMSISINDFSTGASNKKQEALNILSKIKSKVPIVNCNIMISPNMVQLLKNGLMKEILERVDTVYLLIQKPMVVSMDTVKEWLSGLEEFFEMLDGRIILDSCLKSAFGLTDGVCSRHQLIYVNPYGEIKNCSYDGNSLFALKQPQDLIELYGNHYPQRQLFNCRLLNYENGVKQ